MEVIMSYAELEAKIAKIPPEYHQELLDFIDFLKTPAFGFIDFLYWFSLLNFIDFSI